MIRVEDIGELGYGGLVTAAKAWDGKRMAEGALGASEIMKKSSTYAYLLPGAGATLLSAFGGLRRQERWWEHISHGFIYGFPQWVTEVVSAMQGTSSGARGAAVRQAQQILSNSQKQVSAGNQTSRSFEREFDKVVQF